MSFCKGCISGVTHEGTAQGKVEEINGVAVYVGTPTVDYPKDKALLFLPDVFGLGLINNQLLVDDFAKNGYKTYLVDYLNGDPIHKDALSGGGPPGFDFGEWIGRHGQAQTRPLLDKVVKGLKEQGVKEFAATGYCFGARYVFDLAFDGEIKAAVVSHPTFIVAPDDLERYAKSSVPLLINSCEFDERFPQESQASADKILGGGTQENSTGTGPKYKRTYWPGCSHGFAVRGDLSKPEIKAGKEGAFKASVDWLSAHF